jgi:hypothetical protein
MNERTLSTHGGARKGAGRKPSPEPLAVISTTIFERDYRALCAIAKRLNPRNPSLKMAIRYLLGKSKE